MQITTADEINSPVEICVDHRANMPPQEAPGATEPDAPITHPEEMRANFNLRVGDKISLQGAARMTPTGIVSTGITVSAILAAIGFIVWAGRKRS